MSNERSIHKYFGWPTVARLQNGKIAVAASGFRLNHVCPFGKAVLSFSEDEGKTYSSPTPVIDTVLDDRDGGVTPFGEKNVFVSSFNNSVEFQRNCVENDIKNFGETPIDKYKLGYLAFVPPEEEEKALGSEFRISKDYGITFGEIHKSPVTSPHGPCLLSDGTLLWVGRVFSENDEFTPNEKCIQAYSVDENGNMTFVGEMDNADNCNLCEPYAIETDDGKILCLIRGEGNDMFTTFQSESFDKGKTWTKPRQIFHNREGAPAHILKHSSGVLIATYGYRDEPYGIKAMFSFDNGETWDKDYWIYNNNSVSGDLGYPSTVELNDGSLLTVFYAHPDEKSTAVIMQKKWTFEK